MAKQTFTTGQVLTAAQMTSLQQTAMGGGEATAKTASYVLTAADAGTTVIMNAAGATTITVNTALFAAGDTVNIQNIGAGICTVTAGTATVNTAGSLALNQYEGGVLYFRSTSAATFFDYVQTGATSPLTTKGDIWGYSTLDARIPIGANNTVLTADSAEALGVKWAAATGAAIKQIVTNTTSTSSSTTSGSMVDMSNLTATITPSSVSSKILALIYVGGYITQSTAATKTAMAEMNLVRTATQVYNQRFGVEDGFNATNAKYVYYRHTAMYLDSPATTSATTYKCQASIATASQVDWNNPRLVLMEI
jgi:hypothetical protein